MQLFVVARPVQAAGKSRGDDARHDRRRFAVSLWIEQAFSIKEIMTFAGHSSIKMTMECYGHLFLSPDHEVAIVEAKLPR